MFFILHPSPKVMIVLLLSSPHNMTALPRKQQKKPQNRIYFLWTEILNLILCFHVLVLQNIAGDINISQLHFTLQADAEFAKCIDLK